MSRPDTPEWPAVIHHRDDAELLYIASRQQWDDDPDLSRWRYDADDRLIDSNGELFELVFDESANCTRLVPCDANMPLDEFAQLVQRHLFALAQTCVSKVELRDYADGFKTIAMMDH